MTKKVHQKFWRKKRNFFGKSWVFREKVGFFLKFLQNLYKFDLGFSWVILLAHLGFFIFLEWQRWSFALICLSPFSTCALFNNRLIDFRPFDLALFDFRLMNSPKSRGVQYVHWVMHKCIMVKVGGKKYT